MQLVKAAKWLGNILYLLPKWSGWFQGPELSKELPLSTFVLTLLSIDCLSQIVALVGLARLRFSVVKGEGEWI